MQTINLKVTPGAKIGQNELECDITGHKDYVVDDAVMLPHDKDFKLVFELDQNAQVKWDRNNPFGAKTGKCPPTNAQAHSHIKKTSVNDRTLEVEARAPNKRSVVHYRLNFDDGSTCDPIIIHTVAVS